MGTKSARVVTLRSVMDVEVDIKEVSIAKNVVLIARKASI